MTTVIDRHERDVLRREINCVSGALEDLATGVLHGLPRPEELKRARVELALLEDLGWEHDRPGDHFEVTLTRPQFVAWLGRLRTQAEGSAQDNYVSPDQARVEATRHIEHGDSRDHQTVTAELLEMFRRQVDVDLDVLGVTTAILQRIDPRGSRWTD